MMNTVYLLKDPRTLEPRYVGITSQPVKKRVQRHRCDKNRNHRTAWLQSLYKLGLNPIIEILEECEDCQREDTEKAWILGFRQSGDDLVNATDGGEGNWGWHPTQETKDKIGNANRGQKRGPLSESHKNKIRIAHLGVKRGLFSEEHKAKISSSQMGKEISIESRIKSSNSHKGKHPTKETRERMSRAQKGKRHTDESKKKMSISFKEVRNTEEYKSRKSDTMKALWRTERYRKNRPKKYKTSFSQVGG